MNRCFFIGKVCTNIKFDFILKDKNISIVRFYIKLLDGSIIKVKDYYEIADYCYSRLKYGDIVVIEGKLESNINIILKNLKNRNRRFLHRFFHFCYFFNSTTVTPISPSPKVPNLKLFTCGCFFKKVWIPCLNLPVPLPCTILIVFKLVK